MTNSYFRETHGNWPERTICLNFPPHLHDNIEIVVIIDGEGEAFCDGKRYQLKKGDIFITYPNQLHHYENFPKIRTGQAYLFLVQPNSLSLYNELVNSKTPISSVTQSEHFEKIVALIKMAWELRRQGAGKPIFEALANSLFSLIVPSLTLTNYTHSNESVARIIDYCQAHFRESISITDISEHLYMSPGTISRIFSNKIHLSFNDYINSLRISAFLQHMRESQRSITEAALLAGFTTIRTFNESFKKLYGTTPTKYLKSGVKSQHTNK